MDAAPGVGEEAALLKFRILNLESPVLYWASLKVGTIVDEMVPCVICSSDRQCDGEGGTGSLVSY